MASRTVLSAGSVTGFADHAVLGGPLAAAESLALAVRLKMGAALATEHLTASSTLSWSVLKRTFAASMVSSWLGGCSGTAKFGAPSRRSASLPKDLALGSPGLAEEREEAEARERRTMEEKRKASDQAMTKAAGAREAFLEAAARKVGVPRAHAWLCFSGKRLNPGCSLQGDCS